MTESSTQVKLDLCRATWQDPASSVFLFLWALWESRESGGEMSKDDDCGISRGKRSEMLRLMEEKKLLYLHEDVEMHSEYRH